MCVSGMHGVCFDRYGGIMGGDGCIYGVPYTAERVLRINPMTQEVDMIGDELPSSGWKYHGGVCGPDGNIYCIPRSVAWGIWAVHRTALLQSGGSLACARFCGCV